MYQLVNTVFYIGALVPKSFLKCHFFVTITKPYIIYHQIVSKLKYAFYEYFIQGLRLGFVECIATKIASKVVAATLSISTYEWNN